MASPRTMWSGTISLGILSVPVTIGKAWEEERDPSLRDVCECHGLPIERYERCQVTNKRPTAGKTKGIEIVADKWRKLKDSEIARIDGATKSDTLEILDVQPLSEFPLEYAVGSYYVRPQHRGDTKAFALLLNGLSENRGAVVKWCRAARQKLGILRVSGDVMILSLIPFFTGFRDPGSAEREYTALDDLDPRMIELTELLLTAISNPDGFDWSSYSDDGLAVRAETVAAIMAGERVEQKRAPRAQVPDIMKALEQSIADIPRRRVRRAVTRRSRRKKSRARA